MIAGVGLDVVEIARFERLLRRSPGFAARYFTAAEQRACMAAHRPAARWAACFAVKEALLKALGTGLLGGIELRDIEVTIDARGLALVGIARANRRGVVLVEGRSLAASVAWCRTHAWAAVVVGSG